MHFLKCTSYFIWYLMLHFYLQSKQEAELKDKIWVALSQSLIMLFHNQCFWLMSGRLRLRSPWILLFVSHLGARKLNWSEQHTHAPFSLKVRKFTFLIFLGSFIELLSKYVIFRFMCSIFWITWNQIHKTKN